MSKSKKAAAQKDDGGSYRPKKGGLLKVMYRPTDSLVAYERNSRTHTDWQINQVVKSIKEFGWTNPILVDGENGVIAGHARVLAAMKMGLEKVPTNRFLITLPN